MILGSRDSVLNTKEVQPQQGRIPETTLQCIQHLRLHHPQSRISVEVEKPGRDGLRELAREADVVFYSRSWAEVSRTLGESRRDSDSAARAGHARWQGGQVTSGQVMPGGIAGGHLSFLGDTLTLRTDGCRVRATRPLRLV